MYTSENELAEALRRQDRKAQQWVYEQYRLPLFRMCLRYAKDQQEAEDFLHDGMLKAFQDFKQYRGDGALAAWLRKVVLNVTLQHLRRRPRIVDSELAPERSEEQQSDFEEEMNQLSGQQIFSLIRELPEGYRTVFNLFYLESQGHKEIARNLNITEGASKSQLYKARMALRKSIQQQYPAYQYRTI